MKSDGFRPPCRVNPVAEPGDWIASLEQRVKFLDAEIRLSQDCTQGTPIKLLMVRYDELCKGIVAAQDHVAAVLALEGETGLD